MKPILVLTIIRHVAVFLLTTITGAVVGALGALILSSYLDGSVIGPMLIGATIGGISAYISYCVSLSLWRLQ